MMLDHQHPVDADRVATARVAIISTDDTVSYALKLLRTAGLVVFRKRGHVVFYRLSDDFPRQLIEHCLRQLLTIVVPEEA
jgi:DNA-binding transcriptional ArsR family regulator